MEGLRRLWFLSERHPWAHRAAGRTEDPAVGTIRAYGWTPAAKARSRDCKQSRARLRAGVTREGAAQPVRLSFNSSPLGEPQRGETRGSSGGHYQSSWLDPGCRLSRGSSGVTSVGVAPPLVPLRTSSLGAPRSGANRGSSGRHGPRLWLPSATRCASPSSRASPLAGVTRGGAAPLAVSLRQSSRRIVVLTPGD